MLEVGLWQKEENNLKITQKLEDAIYCVRVKKVVGNGCWETGKWQPFLILKYASHFGVMSSQIYILFSCHSL